MGSGQNFYKILGVPADAEHSQIRNAYLGKARKLHPDNFRNSPKEDQKRSEELMRSLNQAWTTLSNPAKRKKYDDELLSQRTADEMNSSGKFSYSERWTPEAKADESADRYATHEEMQLTGFAKIARPIPLLLVLLGGLAILAVVAFFGNNGNSKSTRPVPVPTGVPMACMDFVAGSKGVEVPCGNHDAVIWTTVLSGESCPKDLSQVFNGRGGLFCFTRSEDS
tara:strand:- start:1989 stop:2660 length:672 start_codon:yes stop_codon:yes gene_type:complete